MGTPKIPFSWRQYLRCLLTFNHMDPAVAYEYFGGWRCKKCGRLVRVELP